MPLRLRRLPCVLALPLLLAGAAVAQAHTDPSFNLVNRGTSPIREVYVTMSGEAKWGRNLLRWQTIPPGGTFPVPRRADGKCLLDIKVVFADRRTVERYALNTCTLDAVAVGGPEQTLVKKAEDDPSFRLINRGAVALRELYVTPAGLPGWGRNRLPPDGLPPDAATVIRVARTNHCEFDLRVVFADETALEQRHIDLCEITDVPVP